MTCAVATQSCDKTGSLLQQPEQAVRAVGRTGRGNSWTASEQGTALLRPSRLRDTEPFTEARTAAAWVT